MPVVNGGSPAILAARQSERLTCQGCWRASSDLCRPSSRLSRNSPRATRPPIGSRAKSHSFRSAAAVPANTRYDVTVLPPERFLDEPMPEQRKRDLLGKRYEASMRAGARNSPTVEGRFWLCESDKWELLEAWADGMHTLRELITAMYRHGWKTGPKSQFLNNFAQPPTKAADGAETR